MGELKKFKEFVKDANEQINNNDEFLVLFISFDIVNSSKYKTAFYSSWFVILSIIFERIKKEIKYKIDYIEFWSGASIIL